MAKPKPRSAAKRKTEPKAEKKVVTMDRRQKTDDRRIRTDRRQQPTEVAEERRAQPERRKAARRRQIDPTTCERDYSNDELEFMRAMDEYKRANGRMFPTCSEILEVIRNLGYSRPPGFSCTNAPFGGTIVSGAVEETTV